MAARSRPVLYLLHFDPPYRHAGHYLGYTEDLEGRLARHKRGKGGVLIKAAVRAGCSVVVARTWGNGSRDEERRLKGRSLRPLCPICFE